jgi:hypothetical protein
MLKDFPEKISLSVEIFMVVFSSFASAVETSAVLKVQSKTSTSNLKNKLSFTISAP